MLKITSEFIGEVKAELDLSKRGRANYNIHKDYNDPVQRLFNVANKATYVRPHKHENPDKLEIFVILKGRVLLVEFDNDGKVADYIVLDKEKGNFAVEIPPRAWHTFICLEDGSCLYEVKQGPYVPNTDKNFAPWAPEEFSGEACIYNKKILSQVSI